MTLGLAPKTEAGLAIELSDHEVRFRVDEDVWRSGIDFATALKALKAKLLPP